MPGDEADINVKWQEKVFGPQEIVAIASGQPRNHTGTAAPRSLLSRLEVRTIAPAWDVYDGDSCVKICVSYVYTAASTNTYVKQWAVREDWLPLDVTVLRQGCGVCHTCARPVPAASC